MAKMPEVLKIWIGESAYYNEKKGADMKTVAKVGDEVGVTTGTERSRITTYMVTAVWANCIEIKREDLILAEKRQELVEKLEKKEPLDKRRTASSGLISNDQAIRALEKAYTPKGDNEKPTKKQIVDAAMVQAAENLKKQGIEKALSAAATEILDSREPIDEETTDPEADELHQDVHDEELQEVIAEERADIKARYPGVIKIHEDGGLPPGFVCLAWSSDLKKFGITLQELHNPSNKWLGVRFKKGKKDISVVFGEGVTAEIVAKCMRSVETELGVPAKASKYAQYAQVSA